MNFLVIDGLNLIRRVYAGVPESEDLAEYEKRVVTGCLASINKARRRQQPSHGLCVMDSREPSWRHRDYPPYKTNRPPMPAALQAMLDNIVSAIGAEGIKVISHKGYEADDVIASIAVHIAQAGGQITILSTDKSLCQVLQPGVSIYDHFSDRYLDHEHIRQRYEISPQQLSVYQALVGETSVNIPGVHGIGKRTAIKLIHDHGDLKSILAAADNIGGNIGNKLREGRDDARLALHLLTLKTDLNLGLNLKEFRLETK